MLSQCICYIRILYSTSILTVPQAQDLGMLGKPLSHKLGGDNLLQPTVQFDLTPLRNCITEPQPKCVGVFPDWPEQSGGKNRGHQNTPEFHHTVEHKCFLFKVHMTAMGFISPGTLYSPLPPSVVQQVSASCTVGDIVLITGDTARN